MDASRGQFADHLPDQAQLTTRDKPRVERCASYVRANFYAGEQFRDIGDCRQRAEQWCTQVAGMRIDGTTRCRPAEVFAADEAPKLRPVPDEVFDTPTWAHPKVAPDRHVQIAKALYSVPGELVGKRRMPASMRIR